MSKRRAGNELTKDNWDDEEEKVESGTFQVADDSVLKNRVLKRAKRTLQRDESGELKPIFSGFSGFNSLSSNSNSKQAFSFLSKCNDTPSESGNHPSASTINSLTTSSSLTFSESNSSISSTPAIVNHAKVMKLNEAFVKFITNAVQKNPYCVLTPTMKDYEKQMSKFVDLAACKTNTPDSSMASTKVSPQISVMESKITRIKNSDEVKNNSVNVQTSATSFMNPIGNISNNEQLFSFGNKTKVGNISNNEQLFSFGNKTKVGNISNNEQLFSLGNKTKDANTIEPSSFVSKFNKMIKECKEKEVSSEENVVSSEESQESSDSQAGNNGFKLDDVKLNESLSNPKKLSKTLRMTPNTKPAFNFGSTLPSFSFKSTEQSDTKPFFSFGSKIPIISPISPITLSLPVTNVTNVTNVEAEDEDKPPVVSYTPVKENDAIFESKSKLFCFKNGKYEELGVGQLYLKPIDDTKIQLIMRNDSALGTIMANTLLNESVNFTKRNAKNVQLTCVLDPTKGTKPQTILFKFKDSQTTDSFENELAKLKK